MPGRQRHPVPGTGVLGAGNCTWVLCKSNKLSLSPCAPSPFSLLVSVLSHRINSCCEETQPVKYGLILFGIIWVCFEGTSECGINAD